MSTWFSKIVFQNHAYNTVGLKVVACPKFPTNLSMKASKGRRVSQVAIPKIFRIPGLNVVAVSMVCDHVSVSDTLCIRYVNASHLQFFIFFFPFGFLFCGLRSPVPWVQSKHFHLGCTEECIGLD